MITDKTGQRWGTAADIAAALSGANRVTTDMVRKWAERKRWANPDDALPFERVGRKVYYPLSRAAQIEREKRDTPQGRKRLLDSALVGA